MNRGKGVVRRDERSRSRLGAIDDLARSMRRANGRALERYRPVMIPDKRRASAKNACRGPVAYRAQGR